MNNKIKTAILFCLLIFTANLSYSQSIESKFQEAIDSIYKANPTAIGIMIHVESPKNHISWSGAVGYSNKNTKKKIEPNQPALIASTIKTYVAATILRLVELKKVLLNQPIKNLLTKKTQRLFLDDGYDLDSIKVANLLSHTSGIEDYISDKNVDDYLKFTDTHKKYRWTRDEQLKLTVDKGNPIRKGRIVFNYADANYLLLSEIIEGLTKKPFYTAMRELLKYDELKLNHTWFPTLEPKPKNTKELVHQYFGKYNWDSHDIDISWDLYGGGGIATTTADLSKFLYHFFNGDIIKNTQIRDSIFTEIRTKETELYSYFLGLSQDSYHGLNAYGHGGFWSTVAMYFPSLDASVSVYILERDKRILRRDVLDKISKILKKHIIKPDKNEQEIKNYLGNLKDFSGTILIAHNDSIIDKRAYGLASIEYNAKNNLNTKFDIASITKMITSVAALQLVEQKKIALNKTVGEYLPEYPNKRVRDSVTIHQLLTHTSGLKPFYGKKYLATDKLRYNNPQDYAELFSKDSLMFKPGSKYYYNGAGFVVLGLIIEKISGDSYYKYLDKNVFKPLKMENTLTFKPDSIIMNKAIGYSSFFGDKNYIFRNDYYISKASPAGGYYSTANDLFYFITGLKDYKLLNEETTTLMLTPQVKGFNTHLGYGIDIDQRYDERIIGHSGGWIGVRTELMHFLGSNYTIIVLSNVDGSSKSGASKVIEDLKEIVAGKRRGNTQL